MPVLVHRAAVHVGRSPAKEHLLTDRVHAVMAAIIDDIVGK